MRSKDEDNVGIKEENTEEETLEEMQSRFQAKVNEIYEWAGITFKETRDKIANRVSPRKNDTATKGVKISEIEGNVKEGGLDKGKQKVAEENDTSEDDDSDDETYITLIASSDIKESVYDQHEVDVVGRENDTSKDDDSDDESYLAHIASSNTKESVYDDYEVQMVGRENDSDHEEDELGPESGNGPPRQFTDLDEPEGSAT